jgi:hypothetical protein
MEILLQILEVLPLFFVFGYVVAAKGAKDDIKEIKYILWAVLWAGLFMLNSIKDAIV